MDCYCCAPKPRLSPAAELVQAALSKAKFYTKINRPDPNYKTSKLFSVHQTTETAFCVQVATIHLEGTTLLFKPGMGMYLPKNSPRDLETSSDFLTTKDAKKFIQLFQKFVSCLKREKYEL